MISVTTPDPTVRPPSRIEKRGYRLQSRLSGLILLSFQRYHQALPFQYLLVSEQHQLRQ